VYSCSLSLRLPIFCSEVLTTAWQHGQQNTSCQEAPRKCNAGRYKHSIAPRPAAAGGVHLGVVQTHRSCQVQPEGVLGQIGCQSSRKAGRIEPAPGDGPAAVSAELQQGSVLSCSKAVCWPAARQCAGLQQGCVLASSWCVPTSGLRSLPRVHRYMPRRNPTQRCQARWWIEVGVKTGNWPHMLQQTVVV
jgi:hypothetical protein